MPDATYIFGMSNYAFDNSHSHVVFSVRHMVFAKVRGEFTKWQGTVRLDDADLTRSEVAVTIDASSISTNDAQRDGHLKSPDFLDVEKHKDITFKSTKVGSAGKDKLTLTGDLTIRGVTKPVTLDVELLGRGKDPWGNEKAGFAARGSVDRRDFGLQWNQVLEAGGVLVGEKVEIEIDTELVKAK